MLEMGALLGFLAVAAMVVLLVELLKVLLALAILPLKLAAGAVKLLALGLAALVALLILGAGGAGRGPRPGTPPVVPERYRLQCGTPRQGGVTTEWGEEPVRCDPRSGRSGPGPGSTAAAPQAG